MLRNTITITCRHNKDKKIETEKLAQHYKQQNAYIYLTNKRGVKQLLHFTPFNNIESILRTGILPRNEIPENAVVLDNERFDGRRSCCFSVSFPNYKLFYFKRKKYSDLYGFAVLGINPAIIKDTDVSKVYFYDNNAAGRGVKKYTGTYGAACMYNDLDQPDSYYCKLRKTLELPNNYPTNPQAEVQIRAAVPPQYIECIYVETEQQKQNLLEILGNLPDIKILVGREMFSCRCDYKNWRNGYDK